jgi:hypothetical protein
MYRISIGLIFVLLLVGLFCGWHLPHVLQKQAEREFLARPNNGLFMIHKAIDFSETPDPLNNLQENFADLYSPEQLCDEFTEALLRPQSQDLKTMSLPELYRRSGLGLRYSKYCNQIGRNLYLRNYKHAEQLADRALEL